MFSSLRNQLLIFGAVSTLLIAAMGALGLYQVRGMHAAQEVSAVYTYAMRHHMQADMLHDALLADVLTGNLATHTKNVDALKEATLEAGQHALEIVAEFKALAALSVSPEVASRVKTVTPRVQAYAKESVKVLNSMAAEAPTVNAELHELRGHYNLLETDMRQLRDQIEAQVRASEAHSGEVANKARTTVALVMMAVLALAAAAAYNITVSITRPLKKLQTVAEKVNAGQMEERVGTYTDDELGQFSRTFDRLLDERIAALSKSAQENEQLNTAVIGVLQSVNQLSQRDLTVRAPVTEDVLGAVSDSINMLTEETARVLHGVTRFATQVQDGSEKVRSQAELVSRTAEDERESVAEMIDALADATQTMNQVAALAEQSNSAAAEATQVTNTALETVDGTVRGMETIRETIAETEKRIKRLGERSQEITGIVGLINTISERTHVLALNASMQAAVAGEAGRGFAVVAEEVQRLAESSRNATQQIAALVNNIQLETNETISTVNRTIGQVVHGSEQAQKAGQQMRHTQQITGQLVAQVQRIAEASEEQKTMSAQLLGAVQRIGQNTERTAQQIDTQNAETERLQQSARRLVESVTVFKLPALADNVTA